MSTTNELLSALHGERGELDAWLESRNEKEVRAAILALVSPPETLRDKFAAKAMQGYVTRAAYPTEVAATLSFQVADAMLKAREVKP